jgi:biopolymer transport protein ExbD
MPKLIYDYRSEARINILPILNLFSVLVPFMMLAAVFAEIAIIEIDCKSIGSGNEGVEPERPPLMLTVIISEEGLTVGLKDGFLESIVLNPDGTYNISKLEEQLLEIKDTYPDYEELIIASEFAVKYQSVVRVMDSARKSGFPDISFSGLHGDGFAGESN